MNNINNGLATVIYMSGGLQATRQISASLWTAPQAVIQLLRKADLELPLQFENFRD